MAKKLKGSVVKTRKKRKKKVGDGTPTILRHKNLGLLHDLLLKACPPAPDGTKSITVMAAHMGVTAWAVHKWIQKGKIPPLRAVDAVDLSEGRTTLADFASFVYR